MTETIKCFACDKVTRGDVRRVVTEDNAQHPYVGPDCYRKVKAAGEIGYQPPKGGPRLFLTERVL